MDGKTLLLMLIGGGVAAYLAYSLAKGGTGTPTASSGEEGDLALPPVDRGYDPGYQNPGGGLAGFGLGALGDNVCRLAPSLCSWYSPIFGPRPGPEPLLPDGMPRFGPGQVLW